MQIALTTALTVSAPPWVDAAGSRVVVVGPGADVEEVARQTALRAPAAVLLLCDGGVDLAAATSLLPRGRVLGIPPAEAQGAVEAVLGDAGTDLAVELTGGERRTVRLGAGGAR